MESMNVNGVAIDPAAAAPTDLIRLSDGRVAAIRRGVGRDWLRALRAGAEFGKLKGYGRRLHALIAELTTIDGHPITIYDLEALPIRDLIALQAPVATRYFSGAGSPGDDPDGE